jgi:hypothetical protein
MIHLGAGRFAQVEHDSALGRAGPPDDEPGQDDEDHPVSDNK